MSGERKRTIKLFCPALPKVVQLVAWDEQRLDLGSIARTFGLDPATLKLNGHFISRGVDLIASSVTWKSLISFFSGRGLSTGTTDSDALVVDGKLCKVGTKRAHDPADVENGIPWTNEHRSNGVYRERQLEDTNLPKKKKFRHLGCDDGAADKITKCNNFNLKRKQWLVEDFSPPKRIRMEETNLGFGRSENRLPGTISNTQFPCSFVDENTKRVREDEMAVTAACKKSR